MTKILITEWRIQVKQNFNRGLVYFKLGKTLEFIQSMCSVGVPRSPFLKKVQVLAKHVQESPRMTYPPTLKSQIKEANIPPNLWGQGHKPWSLGYWVPQTRHFCTKYA